MTKSAGLAANGASMVTTGRATLGPESSSSDLVDSDTSISRGYPETNTNRRETGLAHPPTLKRSPRHFVPCPGL